MKKDALLWASLFVICFAELPGFSIPRFHSESGQAVGVAVGFEAVVSAVVPGAEGLVPKALPEREDSVLKARFEAAVVHSGRRLAASVAAEGFAAGSVVLTERFAQKEAELRSAAGWAAEKDWVMARFEAAVDHSAGRSAASAAAEDSAVGWVVPKEHSVQAKEAASRSAVGWAVEMAWSKARFEAVVVRLAGRSVASAAAEDFVDGLAVPKERFVQMKEA